MPRWSLIGLGRAGPDGALRLSPDKCSSTNACSQADAVSQRARRQPVASVNQHPGLVYDDQTLQAVGLDVVGRRRETPGNIADIAAARELATKLPSNGCQIGDMGYDAKPSFQLPACWNPYPLHPLHLMWDDALFERTAPAFIDRIIN
jgi:hypothetical protein